MTALPARWPSQGRYQAAERAKRDAFLTYAQQDPAVCKTEIECDKGVYGKWLHRQYTYTIPAKPKKSDQ